VTVREGLRWVGLIAVSVAGAVVLRRLGVPAPWLIAPLLLAIVAAVTGLAELRVPRWAFVAAQAVIGTLIAQSFTPPIIGSIAHSWATMIAVVGSTVIAAGIAGWILARFSSVPAPTAAWGSSPGAASAMTAMSADYGADPRIVAFMQYLRVTLVVLSASIVSRVLLPNGTPPPAPAGATAFDALGLLGTIAIAAVGVLAALRLRIPAGALLGPMVLGAALHGAGLVRIAVPALLLDAAYIAIGLTIGLQYTPATVRYAVRILPQLLASTFVLIALCAGSAALLAASVHVDLLTAYLATTPGGLDSVTIIALGSGANVPLVLAVQAMRVFVVIVTGPSVAKLVARLA
jgi:membrane AbrB-like protein